MQPNNVTLTITSLSPEDALAIVKSIPKSAPTTLDQGMAKPASKNTKKEPVATFGKDEESELPEGLRDDGDEAADQEDADQEDAPDATKADVQAAARALHLKHDKKKKGAGLLAVGNVLKKFKAKSVNDLKPSQYNEVVEALRN